MRHNRRALSACRSTGVFDDPAEKSQPATRAADPRSTEYAIMKTKRRKPSPEYARGREPFNDIHFEDEAQLQRRLDRQRRLRRLRRKTLALASAFLLGIASSYCASIAWKWWPLVEDSQAAAPSKSAPEGCFRPEAVVKISRSTNGE